MLELVSRRAERISRRSGCRRGTIGPRRINEATPERIVPGDLPWFLYTHNFCVLAQARWGMREKHRTKGWPRSYDPWSRLSATLTSSCRKPRPNWTRWNGTRVNCVAGVAIPRHLQTGHLPPCCRRCNRIHSISWSRALRHSRKTFVRSPVSFRWASSRNEITISLIGGIGKKEDTRDAKKHVGLAIWAFNWLTGIIGSIRRTRGVSVLSRQTMSVYIVWLKVRKWGCKCFITNF